MFIALFQTNVNNNVCCCGSRDVLLSNARNNMIDVIERDGKRNMKKRKVENILTRKYLTSNGKYSVREKEKHTSIRMFAISS